MITTDNALKETRRKIALAFQSLRKQNIRARSNFMCCQNCGCEALDIKGKWGGVFWHAQDDEGFRKNGDLYIAFFTKDGKGSEALGHALYNALAAQGLKVVWDFSSKTRVKVEAESA